MNSKLKRFALYYLPLLANIGLIVYLTWQLNLVPYFQALLQIKWGFQKGESPESRME